jgi:hypothetical protein
MNPSHHHSHEKVMATDTCGDIISFVQSMTDELDEVTNDAYPDSLDSGFTDSPLPTAAAHGRAILPDGRGAPLPMTTALPKDDPIVIKQMGMRWPPSIFLDPRTARPLLQPG